jgi:prepilin-type N-terminal cleavage/methylation domain-containing protein
MSKSSKPVLPITRASITSKSNIEAFTLVELLVAMAILAVLVLLLSGLTNQAARTWQSSEGGNERRQNGRAVIDSIARDLQLAQPPVDRSATNSLQFVKNPVALSASPGYPDSVFFQAPIATQTALGDIAIVGYFLRWLPAAGDKPPQAVLCRFFVNPAKANGDPNPDYRIVEYPFDWINSTLLDSVAPADKDNNYAGLFSENVLGFWSRCIDEGGNDSGDFDTRASSPPRPLPAAVQVSIAVIDARSAGRITPTLRDAIISLSRDASRAPNAPAFVQVIQTDSTFQSLRGGVQAFGATIPLLNSK